MHWTTSLLDIYDTYKNVLRDDALVQTKNRNNLLTRIQIHISGVPLSSRHRSGRWMAGKLIATPTGRGK